MTLTSLVRRGEIYMTAAVSMVNNVIGAAGSSLITRLNILDHGNRQSMQLGDDWVSDENFQDFRLTLGRLRRHFAVGGFVHLEHCQIGNNHTLLRILARLWGVSIYAGTSYTSPVIRVQWGDYVRCDRDGRIYTNVGRP